MSQGGPRGDAAGQGRSRESNVTLPSLMHGDTKVGLALAIVLIGLAAALCFPRTAPEVAPALAVDEARALDAEIEQLPVRAYVGSESLIARAVTPEPPRNVIIPPRPGFSPRDISLEAPAPRPAAVPNPIPPGPSTPEPSVDPSESTEQSGASGFDSGDVILHQVESGDTLSGLAEQYLGSAARFQRIFEANRDQLANPNALKPGMTLRIPPREAETTRIP